MLHFLAPLGLGPGYGLGHDRLTTTAIYHYLTDQHIVEEQEMMW
jgi:hypothetical protein